MKYVDKKFKCCDFNLTEAQRDDLVMMMKALGNPIRFAMVEFLATHKSCINAEMVKAMPIAQATVSQHLKILEASGWITVNAKGTATCCRLNQPTIKRFAKLVGQIFGGETICGQP